MRVHTIVALLACLAASLHAQLNISQPGPVSITAALPAGSNTIGNTNAVQSGTWTVQPGNTANTTPWLTKGNSESGTGAAVPSQATLVGGVSSGNLAGIVACDSSANLTMTTATTTQMVALASGKSIYVCGFVVNGGGTTTTKLVYGTGTNCGTGTANITPPFNLGTGSTVSLGTGLGSLAKTPLGNALCATNSAAANATVFVTYTQF